MDRISSIELALKNEQAEMEYYLSHARRSNNPLARRLFETLAADEQEHMTRIRGLHEKLLTDGSWPEDMPIQVAGTNIKEALAAVSRLGDEASNHDGDDLAALRQGIEFEQGGSKFYAELSEACDNPQEARFFRFLAGIEREHLLSIQDSLFYLEDPEGWLEAQERQSLDGA
mgnify:CR=1 FL=1